MLWTEYGQQVLKWKQEGHLAPLYNVTIEDSNGKPIGLAMKDGTFLPSKPSNLGEKIVIDGKQAEIVWSGGPILPLGGARYIDSTTIIAWMAKREGVDHVEEVTPGNADETTSGLEWDE